MKSKHLTKRMKFILNKINIDKQYEIDEAISLLKEVSSYNNKFIESIDVAINLGIDPRKSDQNIRGTTFLPYGTGRIITVAVFTQGKNVENAIKAGADIVGMEDLAIKIKQENLKMKVDVIIASPDAMSIVRSIGQILGPRGLMPNLKNGTITENITEAIEKSKRGQINYKNEKNGIIHTTIGKINFDLYKIKDNLLTLIESIKKLKPTTIKGVYIKKISLSTTMGCGISINNIKYS